MYSKLLLNKKENNFSYGVKIADSINQSNSRDFHNFSRGSSLPGGTMQDAFIENKQQLSWGPDNDDPE